MRVTSPCGGTHQHRPGGKAMVARPVEVRDQGQRSLPLLARYLREVRERKGVSRAQLAARGFMSASLIEKWELEGRVPTPEKLAAWFDALEVPFLYRKKIISLCQPEAYLLDAPCPAMTAEDERHLERHLDPAFYLLSSTWDLIGANAMFGNYFPGLAHAPASADRPANFLEWLMVDPRARLAVRNWYPRAHVCLSEFRIESPGVVAADRIEEIVEVCREAPEFEQMWATDPSDDQIADPTFTLWDKQRGVWGGYVMRVFGCEYPRRRWEFRVLTPVVGDNEHA
ncbi:helix-turn-helix domain-containing protein [Nocardia brasiliensis]|uniref:helix-turn-helix domain-containing protein n=1 Tax=Nocardia brasiliensis TaxID=37326 RepID=UPI0032B01C86